MPGSNQSKLLPSSSSVPRSKLLLLLLSPLFEDETEWVGLRWGAVVEGS